MITCPVPRPEPPDAAVDAAAQEIRDMLLQLGIDPHERPEHGGPSTAQVLARAALTGAPGHLNVDAEMYRNAYHEVTKVLDEALGTDAENSAGEGIAADVRLLARQRDEARKSLVMLRKDIDQAAQTVKPRVGHPDTGLPPHAQLVQQARMEGRAAELESLLEVFGSGQGKADVIALAHLTDFLHRRRNAVGSEPGSGTS